MGGQKSDLHFVVFCPIFSKTFQKNYFYQDKQKKISLCFENFQKKLKKRSSPPSHKAGSFIAIIFRWFSKQKEGFGSAIINPYHVELHLLKV